MLKPGRSVVAIVSVVAVMLLIIPVRGLLKYAGRSGESPAKVQATSEAPDAPGAAGASPPLSQQIVSGQPPRGSASDLDDLLGMLGQGGTVNNQLNSRKVGVSSVNTPWNVNAIVVDSPLMKKEVVEKLIGSGTREVAEAARRLKPAIELLHQVTAAEKNGEKLLAKLRVQNAPSGEQTAAAVSAYLSNLDDGDLGELVAFGKITREEADEFLRLRGKVKDDFAIKFGQSILDKITTDTLIFRKTHHHRNRAEVLMNNVVAEILAPAVRARAGIEQQSPPVQVKLGLLSKSDFGFGWYEAHVNIRSSAAQELTRLTLLLEFQSPQGSRYATIHIPRLPPTGGGSFDPIPLDWCFLNEAPKDPPESSIRDRMDNTRVRYSVWCDQFRAEGQEPTITLSREEMVNDTRLLALLPGLAYASWGGLALNPNEEAAKAPKPRGGLTSATSHPAPYLQEYEADGRFELVFKKLTPLKQDYEVEVELFDHQAKAKTQPQLLRGVLTLPKVTGDSLKDQPLLLKLTSGNQEMQLTLSQGSGTTLWGAGKGLAFRRSFSPDFIPAPGSPDAVARERMRAATDLLCAHKLAEAEQAYEKIIADYPDTNWVITARRGIGILKAIHRTSDKAQQARAEANQKTLELRKGMAKPTPEVATKQTDTPPAAGRPPRSKSNDSPKRRTPDRPTPDESPKNEVAATGKDEAAKPAVGQTESVTRVTVDNVEYEYRGTVREGANVIVTVRATSKKGDHAGTLGRMTLSDSEGEKYTGTFAENRQLHLREGEPVELTWRFGSKGFAGKSSAPSPKIKRFTLVTIAPHARGDNETIDFHNVPATVAKSKSK